MDDFRIYWKDLTLDSDTAHPELGLSEDCTEAMDLVRPLPVPDHPERFDYWEEVLCSQGLKGRCYWELEWKADEANQGMRCDEAVQGLTAMSSPKTSASFVMISVTAWFIIPLLCPGQLRAQLGTTPNIKHIVIGRCYNYITLVNPSLRYDCEDIWRQFEEAVVRQSSCNVTVEDYHQMFYAMPQTWPCDKFLFWSKTRTLMHSYAAVARHFWTLEDTLVGYMFNDLIWCGQEEDSDQIKIKCRVHNKWKAPEKSFDFSSCPEWSACRNHPVYSLWRQASQNFAEMACGNITVLLNGSIVNAFNRKSMFGSVELDGLNPRRVDYVNIKVVTNLEGPFIESCSQGSIVDLIQILQSRGFRWTCTDNDQTLMILQCIQNPKQSSCQTCANSLLHRRSLTLN